MLATTTTNALISPIARPIASPIKIANVSGVPDTTSLATATPVSVITYANDKSNTRAANGIVIASAAKPVMALELRICLTVLMVGNVSGTQIENTMMIKIQT